MILVFTVGKRGTHDDTPGTVVITTYSTSRSQIIKFLRVIETVH